MRILITDTMYCTEAGRQAAEKIADCLGDVVLNPLSRKLTSGEIRELWDDTDVIIAGTENYDARLLAHAPKSLKLIARNGVSYENIDLNAARNRKIAVTTVRGANSKAVADGTMALMLAVARHLPTADRSVRSGGWNGWVADDVNHKTLGILGFGAIGKEVAKRARGFDMTVLAYSPPEDFDRVFAEQHMPVLPETRGIINRKTLNMMKPSAYLINTSRGALVQEEDLCEALKRGTIRGAALDVFEMEPTGNRALFELENTVLSPHCAGLSAGAIEEMGRINTENILAVSKGETCGGIILGPFRTGWK